MDRDAAAGCCCCSVVDHDEHENDDRVRSDDASMLLLFQILGESGDGREDSHPEDPGMMRMTDEDVVDAHDDDGDEDAGDA